jgi:hypothetical protein
MARLINLENLQQFTAINLTADPGYSPGNRIIPGVAQIRLKYFLVDGKTGYNVLHGSYAGAFHGSQAEANAILTALSSGAQWTALAAFLGTGLALAGVDIRDLGVANAPIIASLPGGSNGASASPSLPSEVAAVITLRTAFTGPANRGRIYMPGWATNALGTADVIAAAAVTALGNWGSIIAGALSAQGYVFGVAHYARLAYTGATGTPHPARPAGLVPITNVAVRDNHWDTVRRRGLK